MSANRSSACRQGSATLAESPGWRRSRTTGSFACAGRSRALWRLHSRFDFAVRLLSEGERFGELPRGRGFLELGGDLLDGEGLERCGRAPFLARRLADAADIGDQIPDHVVGQQRAP